MKDACEIGLVCKEEMNRHKTMYSFIHKTFHEFSAATYLASLAEGDDSAFQRYLKKIDSVTQIDKMEYLMWFCCGLSVKAATLILGHIMPILEKQYEEEIKAKDTISEDSWDYCSQERGDEDPKQPGDKRWNLPLKLFNEAQGQGTSDNKRKDELERQVRSNCERVQDIEVSRHVFEPYPFNISIFLRFVRCIPSLEKLFSI